MKSPPMMERIIMAAMETTMLGPAVSFPSAVTWGSLGQRYQLHALSAETTGFMTATWI